MLILAAIQHHIRRIATAFDCGLTERARGFSDVEAGDFLVATERARQQLVEREAEEEVAEPATPCPIHGEWCAGATCWWVARRAAAGLPNVPAGVSAAPKPAPPAGLSFIDWATPAICEVLAEHHPLEDFHVAGAPTFCRSADGRIHDDFPDRQAWREHVAPLIAARAQTAMAAVHKRALADARIIHRLNAAGFEQGRDFDPPFRNQK